MIEGRDRFDNFKFIDKIKNKEYYHSTDIVADRTIVDSEEYGVYYGDTSGGNVTVTLPTLADNKDKRIIFMKVSATSSYIIDGEGAETINGAANVTLIANRSTIDIRAGTAEWYRFE